MAVIGCNIPHKTNIDIDAIREEGYWLGHTDAFYDVWVTAIATANEQFVLPSGFSEALNKLEQNDWFGFIDIIAHLDRGVLPPEYM
jgi:hypothetical protein